MGKRGPDAKLTFDKLYNEYFKRRYPYTAKRVIRWFPSGYMTIDLWLDDGKIFTYDGERNRIKITERRWNK